MIENKNKTFGPKECWCTQHGQIYYPCKKNKLCNETNKKYKKMKQEYLKSKTYKKDKEKREKRNLERAKRRAAHRRSASYKRFQAKLQDKLKMKGFIPKK